MVTCPKCNKVLEDGTKFCGNCGTAITHPAADAPAAETPVAEAPVAEAPVAEAPVAEAPVAEAPASDASVANAIQGVAASVKPVVDMTTAKVSAAAATAAELVKKQPKKKLMMFAGIGVAALVLIIVVISLIAGALGSSHSSTLYIKDHEMFFTDLKKEPFQISSELFGTEMSNSDLESEASILSYYSFLADDGKTLFFPDKFDSTGFGLYYKDITKEKSEAKKVDSSVSSFRVNKKTNTVTYLKGDDKTLYQYDIKKDEKSKIDSDVDRFVVSEDGKKIVYLNTEGTLYLKYSGKDKEKIDAEISSLSFISENLSTAYYIKDGSLYKKSEGKDKEKISSDVSSVLKVYESGEVFYTKKTTGTVSLMDYVDDDMKDSDALLTRPEAPTRPWSFDFDSYDEYQAAYDAYLIADAEYNNALTLYNAKINRDSLRQTLESETLDKSDYSLFFYDGKEEKTLSTVFAFENGYTLNAKTPVMIFKAYKQSSIDKIKLSEVTSAYSLKNKIETALHSETARYVAVKGTATEIDASKAEAFKIDNDGKNIYYIDNIAEDKNYGDLIKLHIEKDIPGKAETYDTDVSTSMLNIAENGAVTYFKDFKNGKGELYINKEKVDFDVYAYSLRYYGEKEMFVYFTDWSSEKSYGTIKSYKGGKSTKIVDEAHSFTALPNGDILYISEYSTNYGKGELYLFKNGKAKKIDDDVVAIIPILDRDGLYDLIA